MHSFREYLRDETAAVHARLDARLSALDLTRRDDYGAFLILHSAVLPGLEAETARACAGIAGLDMERRRRTGALNADLAALRLAPAPPMPVTALDGAAQGLGALYVLEGSRLGARVLVRRVRESGDGGVRAACAYLVHGETERLFAAFLDVAAAHLASPAALADARTGALTAFEAFDRASRFLGAVNIQAEDGRARG